ncbi:MAG: RDD family protein [Actinomycetota bacterium]
MSNAFPPPPPPPSWSGGSSSPGASPAVAPVSVGTRVAASLLDVLLMIVTLGIGWIIWAVVLLKQSTSPAKKMMGLVIVDVNTGAPATMTQMVLREIVGKWVLGSVTGVVTLASFVMLFVTPNRQAVWDYIGTSTVVRRP